VCASWSGSRRTEPSPFARRVLAAVRRIPAGLVATYGDIAALAGSPRAARAVGSILRECRDPYTPCHRVIGAGGSLGGFGGNIGLKRARLAAEGLEVTPTRVRGFSGVRWRGQATRATHRRNSPV
jgi:O-6-methylguanine DNA methyltransferase